MIQRFHHSLDDLIAPDAEIEKLAGGFTFTEGPIWMPEGHLIFSDIPENRMYKWTPDGGAKVFREPSGFNGKSWPKGAFVGSNGMTLDPEGRLVICEHGNRRVTRLEPDGSLTVLASHYQGKRLNSPNDVVFKSDGSMFFTDPPYGLAGQDDDPAKELDFCGLFRLKDGELTLMYHGVRRPNGLAFSPDERHLYLANSDPQFRCWMQFYVNDDGSLDNGMVFADLSDEEEAGNPDGMKLDVHGNLYCTGPGGTHVFTPEGGRLGVIITPEIPANLHWGDADAKTLYITARTGLYRLRMKVAGIRPKACGRA